MNHHTNAQYTARDASVRDIEDLLGQEEALERKASGGALAAMLDDVRMLFAMVRDYFSGEYDHVPLGVILSAAGVLLYVLSPLDLVPDFIPVAGLADDATVVAFFLYRMHAWIDDYRMWREGRR